MIDRQVQFNQQPLAKPGHPLGELMIVMECFFELNTD
jgi:hypothetical protein